MRGYLFCGDHLNKSFILYIMFYKRLALLISILSIAVAIVTATPFLRNKIRSIFIRSPRQVIVTTRAHLKGDDQQMLLVKVKENQQLFLEIYSETESQLKFLQRFLLDGSFDGYFTLSGEATNLVVTNLDPDPPLEIVVPSFDEEFVAHLQIIKYNIASQKFEFLEQENWPLPWKSKNEN